MVQPDVNRKNTSVEDLEEGDQGHALLWCPNMTRGFSLGGKSGERGRRVSYKPRSLWGFAETEGKLQTSRAGKKGGNGIMKAIFLKLN